MKNGKIMQFSFGVQKVRTLNIDGEPWFVARDVCSILKIQNVTQAIEKLDEDERSMFNIGRQGKANIISESGMYFLTIRCRDAVKKGTLSHLFRKWVTSEVLPQIRKTGNYRENSGRENPQSDYRYLVHMVIEDTYTGQIENFSGGAQTSEDIIRGTAKRFNTHIVSMRASPVPLY